MNTIEMLPCGATGESDLLAFMALEVATIKLADRLLPRDGKQSLNYARLLRSVATVEAAMPAAKAALTAVDEDERDDQAEVIYDAIAAFGNAAWALEEAAIALDAAEFPCTATRIAAKRAADVAADLVDPVAETFGFPGKAELLARRARLSDDAANAENDLDLLVSQGFEGRFDNRDWPHRATRNWPHPDLRFLMSA